MMMVLSDRDDVFLYDVITTRAVSIKIFDEVVFVTDYVIVFPHSTPSK